MTRPQAYRSLTAATEARARLLEQRQALIEAALSGQKIDPAMIQAAATNGRLANDGPLARVEQQQLAAGRARRQGARRPLPGHRRRAEEARHQAGPSRQPTASAVRSRASAIRPSRRCSTAGRSSTSCRTTSSPFRPTSRSRPRSPSPAASAFAPIRSTAVPRCTRASTLPAPTERRSTRLPTAPCSAPAGTAAATAISSSSTTAAESRPATATCRRSSSMPAITSPAASRSAAWARPAARPATTFIMRCGSTGAPVNPIPFMKSTDYVLAMQKRAGAAVDGRGWRSAAPAALTA